MNAATAEFSPLARNIDEAHASPQGNMLRQKREQDAGHRLQKKKRKPHEHVDD
jgi:hypothetical protein